MTAFIYYELLFVACHNNDVINEGRKISIQFTTAQYAPNIWGTHRLYMHTHTEKLRNSACMLRFLCLVS